MPNNKENKKRISKGTTNMLDIIDNNINNAYGNTFLNRVENKKSLDQVTSDIYDAIDNILFDNTSVGGVSNIDRLYNKTNKTDLSDDLNSLFTTNQLLNPVYLDSEASRSIKLLDHQYDLICKYMTKLDEALKIKKDNVLSSENFSKDFIQSSTNSLIGDKLDLFEYKTTSTLNKYKFQSFADKLVYDVSKYGEQFVYIVPYKKALERLLRTSTGNLQNIKYESTTISIDESNKIEYVNDDYINDVMREYKNNDMPDTNTGNIKIEFNKNGLLNDVVSNYYFAENAMNENSIISMSETYLYESGNKSDTVKFNYIMNDKDKLEFDPIVDNSSRDGLIQKDNESDKINDIPGALIKILDHSKVFPIYIEEICMGYIYLETFKVDDMSYHLQNCGNDLKNKNITNSLYDDTIYDNEKILRVLSSKISTKINANFINVNQDLKEEIYSFLKFNENIDIRRNNSIRVTFIPKEDITHCYYELNKETHRGISDLERGLIPAMYWCLLDLTITAGIVTRSADKRVYYIKQNVETNVSKTLMNTINQIKKGNMGIRQMQSMNNILNIVGKYNDYVIPLGPNGDAPIQFEVMQGQNIETPDTLLNKYEELAINSTDVSLEIINSVLSSDYAIRYSMANSKFATVVTKRQFITQNFLSPIFTKIYNYENKETESNIKITLPTPILLSMTNGSQIIENVLSYAEAMAKVKYGQEDSPSKNEFVKLLTAKMLSSYISNQELNRLSSQADINVAMKDNENENQ